MPRDHVGSDSMFSPLKKNVDREKILEQYMEQSDEFQAYTLNSGGLSLSHGQ